MPLTRYQIRNEFSLADPELFKAADKDDPEALLEGVAMAGLVGVLRQLGDLAEVAAEIFHDLHEEVMATAARGHGLVARVQQLEAEFPSIEKAFLCQTNHSLIFTNAGVDWHPNLRTEHNLITQGDLPRCVLDSYEECRGPPRLFLLDKFDVAGAGACLKRYTDPSFFKAESAFPELAPIELQREKKARKVKKKGLRWRNGETPEVAPTSHAKLNQLFLEERIENAYNDPACLVKLKRRQLNESPLELKSGKSYMEKFLESPSPEHKAVYETFDTPPLLKMIPDNSSESGLEIVEIGAVSPMKRSSQGKENLSYSPDAQVALRSSMEELNGEVIDREIVKMPESTADFTNGIEKDILVDGEGRKESSIDGDHSDDMISEVDNYTDALTTMGSEMDTDNGYRPKNDIGILDIRKYQTYSDANEEKVKVEAHTSDSQSVGISSMSDDGNSSFKKGRSSCSYSDTIDKLNEDMQSNGEVATKAFPSNKNCVEIVEGQSNQLPAYAEMQCSTSDMALVPKDTFFGEYTIPDIRGAFYGSYLDDLNSTHVKLDQEASPIPFSLAEPQLDEVPHEDVKTNSGLSDKDGGKNIVDSSEDTFDSCEKQEALLITCSAESHHVDGLGSRDTNVSFSYHALSHSSHALSVVPEKNSDDPLDEISKTGSAAESFESSVHQIFGLSNSDILPAEEPLPCSTLAEIERSSAITQSPEGLDVTVLVNLASEGNDVTLEAGTNSVCLTPTVSISHTCGFNEQQHSNMLHDDIQLEGDSIEVAASYNECKQNVEEPFDAGKGEETCRVKTVEEDIVPCDLPSDCAHNLELYNHVGLDDLATENIYAKGIAVSAAASGSADFDDDYVDNTIFSSRNLMTLQEPLSGAGDQCQGGWESNEVISQDCLKESEAQDIRNQVEGAPADVDSSESKLATYDSFSLEDDIQYSLAEPTKNILNLNTVPASSEMGDQESEPKYPSHLMESRSDVVSSPTHYLSEKETALGQSLDLHSDQHDSESLLVVEDISNSLNILSGQIQSLDNVNQTSSENSVEGTSSQPTLEVSQQSVLQDNQEMFRSDSAQPSLGLLHEETKVSLEEMPPLPPLPPMQWRMGRVQHASPASQGELAEHGQGSFPMIPPYATEQKAQFGLTLEQGIEQPRNPFLPIINGEESSCHVPNQLVTDVSHPGPFPMHQPPMGKGANSQCNGIGLDGTNANPFLTLPTESSESLGYGSVAMESDRVESSQSLVPMLATEYTNSGLTPLSSQEKTAHAPNQFVPDTGLEGGAFQDPKQNSETEHGNPDISVVPPAKTEEQSTTKLAQEDPTEAVEQFPAKVEDDLAAIERETASASNAIFLHGLAVAEGETTQTTKTNLQHNFSTPEEEVAWPPHTLALSPVIEDGNTDGNPTVKPPRPRNPLIDAVAAHDKSKMRKVTERVRTPTIPKVDERGSLLEQIRNKSFNLKPAAVTRPSIQGPKTNLRVAAILEKASAIRQALAGSDEDDDEDGWSDS